MEAVSPVAAHYSPFLRILGLPESQLAEIKTECRDSPQECLQKGIICLLRENFNTDKYGPLTWRRLVVAVADTAGGNNHTLAKKIAAEHKGKLNSIVEVKDCITYGLCPIYNMYHLFFLCKFQNCLTVQ